jgi:hypothetical protein
MGIPESQLKTWANQGATTTAKATHESIRNALSRSEKLKDKSYEVYLQGSYKNDTNIRGDSDVDVVVQLNSTFFYDLSRLPPYERDLCQATIIPATYQWADFREDVLSALKSYYGATAVSEGNCALGLTGGSGRLPAHVVVCLQYRQYLRFRSSDDQSLVEGIKFFTRRENRAVINFPKLHYDNSVKKNGQSRTDGMYKPVVRVFKNARSYMVDHGSLSASAAPSYFLECMLYNVPDSGFSGSYQDAFCGVVNWLAKADMSGFVCQNGLIALFGASQEQWSPQSAATVVTALINLWNGW